MKIALLQYPIVWGNIEENLRLTEQRLAALQGKADVALLAEMFTTGFCVEHPELAQTNQESTIVALHRWASAYNLAIAGSFMAREGNVRYNRGFFIRPDGTADFIDKRHLYAHGGEARFFTAGKQRQISLYKGVRFCLQICYDLRFPVWSRNRTGYDYDVLLYCAAWPDIRIQYWDALLAARATENQCVVCGVNCVGTDGMGLYYSGHSVAYDTRLNPLVQFAPGEASTKIADVDVQAIHHFREKLPLWQDADSFEFV